MTINAEFLTRAEKIFVGGVNSPVRSFRRVGGHPIIVKRAHGAFIEDVAGNEYFDLVMSYGPHLFGHQYPPIVEAVARSLGDGFCYGMTSEKEIIWGEKLLSFLPPNWKVRALSSGTEACMTAVRLARGYTGKEIIVKCSGHYHGHVDSLLFDAGSGVASLSDHPVPDSAGIPHALAAALRIIPFNDIAALEKTFRDHSAAIAGIIFEPVMGNMGVVMPKREFLQRARELADEHRALLIFDEVMTGFRVARDSAFGRFAVMPDLITFGKIVGGGLPLAALAGSDKFLASLSPEGPVYQAGTLSGNPLGVAAGCAMLCEIDRVNPYPHLEELGRELESVLNHEAQKRGIAASVVRCGSMLSTHFRREAPTSAAQTRDVDHELFKKFFWSAIKNEIMLPPSPFEAYFLSMAHVGCKDQLLSRFAKAFREL